MPKRSAADGAPRWCRHSVIRMPLFRRGKPLGADVDVLFVGSKMGVLDDGICSQCQSLAWWYRPRRIPVHDQGRTHDRAPEAPQCLPDFVTTAGSLVLRNAAGWRSDQAKPRGRSVVELSWVMMTEAIVACKAPQVPILEALPSAPRHS